MKAYLMVGLLLLTACGSSPVDNPKPEDPYHTYPSGYMELSSVPVSQMIVNNEWGKRYPHPTIVTRYTSIEDSYVTPSWDVRNIFTDIDPVNVKALTHANTPWEESILPPSTYYANQADIGIFLNTETIPRRTVVGGGYHALWSYQWGLENGKYPWVAEGDLSLQIELGVPISLIAKAEGEVAVPQVSIVMYGRDISDPDNHYVWCIVINLHDPRGKYAPVVSHDTFSYFFSTPWETNESFTVDSGEFITSATLGLVPFKGRITYSNFEYMLGKQNLKMESMGEERRLSLDTKDHVLMSAAILVEIVAGDNSDVAIGTNWRNFQLNGN